MSVITKEVQLTKLIYKVTDKVTKEDFALCFLNLYNNVQSDYRTFLDMKMYSNDILVLTVKNKDAYAVKDWMGFFNDVWRYYTEEVVLCTVLVDKDDTLNEDILLNKSITIADLED